MSALLTESTAVLKERAAKVGLPDDALQRLLDQGVDTLAKLAFAPGHPGESPSDEKLKALVAPVAAPGGAGGAEPSLGTVAAVRRLVFEAQTLVVNETKCLVKIKKSSQKNCLQPNGVIACRNKLPALQVLTCLVSTSARMQAMTFA